MKIYVFFQLTFSTAQAQVGPESDSSGISREWNDT